MRLKVTFANITYEPAPGQLILGFFEKLSGINQKSENPAHRLPNCSQKAKTLSLAGNSE